MPPPFNQRIPGPSSSSRALAFVPNFQRMGPPVPDPSARSPLSAGIAKASRISTIGLEFFVPALLGHLLDVKLGTGPWALLVGMALGFAVGMVHLLRIARDPG